MRTYWILIVGLFLGACSATPVQPESVAINPSAPGAAAGAVQKDSKSPALAPNAADAVKDPAPIHQDEPPRTEAAPVTEADELLQADRDFAARSLLAGAAEAFFQFLDEEGMQLPAAGEPVVGPDNVRDSLAQGPKTILSWEPRYAELLTDDWGWTWGEWQAHEPGAGGRRIAQGKYINLWKKQPDGNWKVRLDMGNVQPKPAP